MSEVAFPLASMVTFDYPARGTKPECRVIWYDGGLLPPKPKAMGATPLPQEGVLYVGTKGTILFNDSVKIENIPAMAYDYVVNGKSAVEWVMERYAVTSMRIYDIADRLLHGFR